MKLYSISGLGADKRVFSYLNLKHEVIHLDWIVPEKDETIIEYSKRISNSIDTSSTYGIIGVSFGGMIAVEISKQLKPAFTILISSAETKNELRFIYKILGRLRFINFLPKYCFNIPKPIANYIFGAKNKSLLKAILDDADLSLTKWSVNQILTWNNETRIDNLIKIGGSKDKLIPQTSTNGTLLIEKGQHFMIVDKADEVSRLINSKT